MNGYDWEIGKMTFDGARWPGPCGNELDPNKQYKLFDVQHFEINSTLVKLTMLYFNENEN